MVRSTVVVALVLLVVIQSMCVDSWLWRRRRRRRGTNCSYPKTSKYARSSAYYYGDTSLWGSKKGKRGDIVGNTWRLRHSLLQFRGTIFEWGIKRNGVKTYDMSRPLGDCRIKWSYSQKGVSRCLLSDAETWTRAYRRRYGRYKLLSNNCHNFVNKLGRYLATNCGR